MGQITLLGLSLALVFCYNSLVDAKAFSLQVSEEVLDGLSNYLQDVYRYENPVNRDHFYYIGTNSTEVFSDFKFKDYRFDGYVTNVLKVPGYDYIKQAAPEALPYLISIYHGYHKDMKHNYFSKPWEPYFEGPVLYCMRRPNLLNATNTLWTLDGQPIDSNGNLGYDTIYTNDLVERDLPNVEDYVMYRVLCYTWDKPESDDAVKAAGPSAGTIVPFAHANYARMDRVFQYFNEHTQDHYYKIAFDKSDKDRANFVNVAAYVLNEKRMKGIRNCVSGKNLAPLIEAYNEAGTDHMLFVGEDNYEKIVKEEGLVLTDKKTLGYVALTDTDECHARYQLNIRIRLNQDLIHNNNDTKQGTDYHDKDVYLAPNALNTTDPLFHDQKFYVW